LQVCITVLHTSPRVWVVSLMTSQMGWFDWKGGVKINGMLGGMI
jgi:hypothetical protein